MRILRNLILLSFTLICGFAFESNAQNNVGIGTSNPEKHAILDLKSTYQGFLVPRLTTAQRTMMDLNGDADAMIVYDTDYHRFFFWNGILLNWQPFKTAPDNDGSLAIIHTGRTGTSMRAGDAANGMQTIPHALGATPKMIHIRCMFSENASEIVSSEGSYDGTNQNCITFIYNVGSSSTASSTSSVVNIVTSAGDVQSATITMDAVNIYLTWTKTGTPSSNPIQVLWDAEVY